jgi:2-methylfumaryl-CoA isomerase
MSSEGVLAGLQVVEVSAFVAAPFAGMVLAQLGAEVIRVDPVGGGIDHDRWPVTGDGQSLYWAGLNKGKRSMAVDVRSDEGRDLVRRLVTAPGANRGILVTNLAPRWLDYESLRELRPDLIMVSLSGNPDGSTAVDYTVNAAAGYPDVTGGDGPVNHVLPAWDLLAGSMVATAVLAAERRRRPTGRGELVRVSLADVAFTSVGHLGHVAEVVVNDVDRERYGNYLYGAFGKDFESSDGQRVMVVALSPRQWSALVGATGSGPELAEVAATGGWDFTSDGDRFRAREEIAAVLAPWFASRRLDDIARALDDAGVLWGPYRTFRGLVEDDERVDPDVNPIWRMLDQPGIGRYPAPGSPLRFSEAENLSPRPSPELGADTAAILTEILGLDAAEIEQLREQKVW